MTAQRLGMRCGLLDLLERSSSSRCLDVFPSRLLVSDFGVMVGAHHVGPDQSRAGAVFQKAEISPHLVVIMGDQRKTSSSAADVSNSLMAMLAER